MARSVDYPPPSAFGLPFPSWRPGQWEIATSILESDFEHHMLIAPTGFGKSATYMGLAALSGGRTVILTATKALQDQLVADFQDMGLYDVRGRGAYPCVLPDMHQEEALRWKPSMTAATAPCRWGFECRGKEGGCPYFDRVRGARHAELIVTNYDFWLYNDVGKVDCLIMDEAHQAPDELADFLSFHMSPTMRKRCGTRQPQGEEVAEWREWAKLTLNTVKGKLERHQTQEMLELAGGLEKIIGLTGKGEWVVEFTADGGIAFDCVDPESFGSMLWGDIKRVVMVSATCNQMTAQAIGLRNVKVWEAPSAFPVDRRMVWAIEGAVQVNFRMVEGQRQMWANLIDRILAARPDRKGIVHTTSFERARYLLQHSSHSSRLLLNDSHNTRNTVAYFKEARSPLVLVSPSVTTGYDFPYSQCEFQVIGKIPFPDLRSKAAKIRTQRNKEWAGYMAAQQLVQSSGRGMRAEDDRCETFIADGNFGWWWRGNRKWTPRWWQEAVRVCTINSLPEKPERAER